MQAQKGAGDREQQQCRERQKPDAEAAKGGEALGYAANHNRDSLTGW